MEIKAFFKELVGRLDRIELTGTPRRIESTFVSGLKALPVRYAISA
jgi:cytochrome P450